LPKLLSSECQCVDLTPSFATSTAASPSIASSAPPGGLMWAQARLLLTRNEGLGSIVA
jgi:hypothetical protein